MGKVAVIAARHNPRDPGPRPTRLALARPAKTGDRGREISRTSLLAKERMPMAGEEQHELDAIREVNERLARRFSPRFSTDQIGAAVDAQYHRFDGSKVRTYIPLLVEHGVRDQLRPERSG
jgi:hypothetical protein